MSYQQDKFTEIANAIRNKTGTTDKIKPSEFANKVSNVYEAGYEQGKAEGGDTTETIKILTQALLARGNRSTDYRNVFDGSTIDDTTMFQVLENWNEAPNIGNATNMFQNTKNISESLYTDKLDFSNCVSMLSTFGNSSVRKLKVINARATIQGWNGMTNMFLSCTNLESIDEFYPSTGTNMASFSNTFAWCYALTHIIFMSEIAQDGLDLKHCPLDKDSLMSVINMLSDTTTGLSVALSLTAVNNAFDGGRDGAEWQDLIKDKPNWEIKYT